MTWHDISQLTTLPHLTSPHNQPHYFIAPCNQPHRNRSPRHHHGTAEGSFTQKTRFGHRSGWSPCAHSIGKFFLWLIVFFFETSAPSLPGSTCIYIYFGYLECLCSFVFLFSSKCWLSEIKFSLAPMCKCKKSSHGLQTISSWLIGAHWEQKRWQSQAVFVRCQPGPLDCLCWHKSQER